MSSKLKIIFAGTPEIARFILAKILDAGFKIELILTQPDRPKGRGQKLAMSPVKELAQARAIEVLQPVSFKHDYQALARISELQPDLIVVIAYGLILPQAVLNIPKLGCVNIHMSLLPRYRGAAPIQRAILNGDKVSGVSIMQMDSGLDTGDILLDKELEIASTDTSGSLQDKLAVLGADLIIKYLHNHANYPKIKQSNLGITYAHKIEKVEAEINWHENAEIIARKIRGYNPFPGCFTYLGQHLIKIWQAKVGTLVTNLIPGTVILNKDQLLVSCGNGSTLIIEELQSAGKTRQSVEQYLHGNANLNGKQFTALM